MTVAQLLAFAAIGTILGSVAGTALALWSAPKIQRFLENRGLL